MLEEASIKQFGVDDRQMEYVKLFHKFFDSNDELKNAYKNFHESGMQRISILTNYSRKVNESIKKLSDQFNEIYSFNGEYPQKGMIKIALMGDKYESLILPAEEKKRFKVIHRQFNNS